MRILKLEDHHFVFEELEGPLNIHIKIILGFISINLLGVFYEDLFHLVYESLHILFEYVEEGLDMLIEHFFETGTHETQVVVFYILSPVCLLLAYSLYRLFPRFYTQLKKKVHRQKVITLSQWYALPLIQRFEWWAFFVFYISSVVFFSF